MRIRRRRSAHLVAAAFVLAFISPVCARDESYGDYTMRRVSEGLAAQQAVAVVDRLEGAQAAMYAWRLKEEGAPDDFIRKTSEALWVWLAKETEPWVRHFLVEALGRADAVLNRPRLRALLDDRDPTVRARAAGYIAAPLTGDEEDELIKRLAVEDLWWVKKEILLALAGGKANQSLVLLHVALGDPSRGLRAAASVALVSRPDPTSVEPLLGALDKAGLFGSESPVWALGAIKSPAAVDGLRRHADSPYPPVRYGAAYALGEIGDQRCVPALGGLLDDEDAMVQEEAADALAKVGGKEAALHLLRYLSLSLNEKRLHAALRIDREELLHACEEFSGGASGIPDELRRRRHVCGLVQEHIADERITFWSSYDLHSAFYSPFNAKAREVAPEKGRRASGWKEFIGRQHNGTKQALRAGTRVTIWKAAYYRGETWLDVKQGPYSGHIWIREADLKIIPPEDLKHLAVRTNYGGGSELRMRAVRSPEEKAQP